MNARGVLGAVALAAVLAFGFGGRDEAPALEPAPAAVVVPSLTESLAVSETTRPPGWVHPDERMAEEQLYAWLDDARGELPWQAAGVLVTLAVLTTLVVALEKGRHT